VDVLLERARVALRARRYTDPPRDNALAYYRSAADADPTNAEARDGLQRVASVLITRLEQAMKSSRFDEAAAALANLKLATPHDAQLSALELRVTTAQITKAIADGAIDRAGGLVQQAQQAGVITADQAGKWRADITRLQDGVSKIRSLAGLVANRINEGKLVDPPEDSARGYALQLQAAAPNSAVTAQALRDLNTAYLRKAREAVLAKNNTEVDRWLQEAHQGGANTSEIDAVRRDLGARRQSADAERLLGLVHDRLREGKLTDPGQDSAAYYLLQLENADPSYPGMAAANHELATKLLEQARSLASAGKSVLADADLFQAKRYGADPKEVSAIQQLETAHAVTANAARAPAPTAAPPVAASVSSSAGSTAVSGTAPSSGAATAPVALVPKRVRYVQPIFPEKAITQNVSGSVTVQFIIDVNGDPRDVRVIEASPPRVFEQAAISAVKRWHYQPTVVNGKTVEVPVQYSFDFQPPR